MPIKLIVGLRNPGLEYAQTRHNAGGWLVEALKEHYPIRFKADKKLSSELARIDSNGVSCTLMLPLTFMNHSGLSVRAVSQFYRIEPQDILIAHDDLDLAPGRIKLKTGGGHGGHNGLRDVIHHLGSTLFHRLRVGIGHPGDKELVLNYVLGQPSKQERECILQAIARVMTLMPTLLSGDLPTVMNQLNGKDEGDHGF
jgi:PTH1 family peptidyl-tRNA hydrolase